MKRLHILLLSGFIAAILITLTLSSSKIKSAIGESSYGNNNLKGKFYSVNGFRMYVEVYGSGEPLLMIHGNGGSIAAFRKQIPYFSKQYKVIVADSRAQGKSADTADSLTYEQMADDYAALLTLMHIKSANVLGWSDGGIIGLLLSMRHPEKIKKLVIIGANLWPGSTAISESYLKEKLPRYHQLKKIVDSSGSKIAADSLEFKLMKLLAEQPHIALTDLKMISSPILVIGGDRDIILPSHTLQIFQHLPNAYLWIVPNSGHAPLIEYEDEFNKKTAAFFQTSLQKGRKKG